MLPFAFIASVQCSFEYPALQCNDSNLLRVVAAYVMLLMAGIVWGCQQCNVSQHDSGSALEKTQTMSAGSRQKEHTYAVVVWYKCRLPQLRQRLSYPVRLSGLVLSVLEPGSFCVCALQTQCPPALLLPDHGTLKSLTQALEHAKS